MKNNKRFDCLKEKERIHAEMLKEIKGMTLEEERAYYNRPTGDKKLDAWISKVKQHSVNRSKLKKSS